MPEALGCEPRCHIDVLRGSIILIFGFGRRDVADGLRSFERGIFDGFEAAPWPKSMDHLSFVEAVNRLSQSLFDFAQDRIVIAVIDAADRWLDPGLGEAFGVFDRDVLGGFNRSSQRAACRSWRGIDQALRRVFSSPMSYGVCH